MISRNLDKATQAYEKKDAEASRRAHMEGSPEAGEPHKEGGERIKSLIYGGLDGIITTFAVVAGAAGAELAAGIVLIMGFANLIADGISMAIGDYLSTQAEDEVAAAERTRELWEVENYPEGEELGIVEADESPLRRGSVERHRAAGKPTGGRKPSRLPLASACLPAALFRLRPLRRPRPAGLRYPHFTRLEVGARVKNEPPLDLRRYLPDAPRDRLGHRVVVGGAPTLPTETVIRGLLPRRWCPCSAPRVWTRGTSALHY